MKNFHRWSKWNVGNAINKALKKWLWIKGSWRSIMTPSKTELNLLNVNKVNDWFELNKPSIVILAAAKVGGILAN